MEFIREVNGHRLILVADEEYQRSRRYAYFRRRNILRRIGTGRHFNSNPLWTSESHS